MPVYRIHQATQYRRRHRPIYTRQTLTLQGVAGVLTVAGALQFSINKLLAGNLTPSSTIHKLPAVAFSGTLTSSSLLTTTKVVLANMAGTLATAGILVRQPHKLFASTLVSVGIIVKRASANLAGVLSSSGVLVGAKISLLSISGTLITTGSIVKSARKRLLATLSTSSIIHKYISKSFAGTLITSGLTRLGRAVVFVGSLLLNGAITRQPRLKIIAALITSSSITKYVSKRLSGVLIAIGKLIGTIPGLSLPDVCDPLTVITAENNALVATTYIASTTVITNAVAVALITKDIGTCDTPADEATVESGCG